MIEIPLTQGKVAIVDDDDARLAAFKWYARRDGRRWYALRHASRGDPNRSHATILLHREVLGVAPGICVDHVNGDGLDCRRGNLRPATKAQNAANQPRSKKNKTGFKGVYACGRSWRATIRVNGQRSLLGRFASPEAAALAYDAAARERHGAFAVLNFPTTSERPAA